MSSKGLEGAAALTSFVGRRHDLREARRLLGNARLVTLVGPGGVGKTRIARRLADEVARAFPDGTYVVEMAGLHDPEAILTELASSLGVEDTGASHQLAVASFVRQRRLLVVLDNCEHLVTEAGGLVSSLLRESTGLSVVATSRQPLGVAGEQLMVVEPLSLPDGSCPPAGSACDSEAVQLFVDRARLVAPGFALTEENAPLVRRVCTTLDGMPLAIELAAARLRMLSLGQLAERLHDRFGVLAVAATPALPRQQTLRASVDWSFELCSPEEQTLWAQMSVFEGGCDLDAVEAVCAATGVCVFDTVAALVDKSVLTPEESAGRVRYRMLQTIRAYGRERLAERGDFEKIAQQHRAYFVGLARRAGHSWFGSEQRDLMARIAVEHANLRVAFEACLASPATYQDALVLCTSIWWFWVGHGGIDEVVRWLGRALALDQPPTPLTLHATSRAAFLAAMRGDSANVATYAERALSLPLEDECPRVRWDRRWAQTLLLSLSGDFERACELDLETLQEEPPPGPVGLQETVNALMALAQRRAWTGRPAESLEHVDEGIRICRCHGDEWSLSFFLCTRGARLAELGRHQEALDAEREALRLSRGGFHSWTVVHALEFSAQILCEVGEGTAAAVLLGALSSLWPDIGGVLLRSDQPRHAALEARVRQLVDGEDFTHAFERGRRMSLESVVAFVLGEDEPVPRRSHAEAAPGLSALTRRELEVAELVARGLSNKEIAQTLVLSPRTAEGHVARLLDKLGFDSRARVAAWVAERRAGGSWPPQRVGRPAQE